MSRAESKSRAACSTDLGSLPARAILMGILGRAAVLRTEKRTRRPASSEKGKL
jgi:hypothetical protein